MQNMRLNRILWLVCAALAFAVAVVGVARPAIYDPVAPIEVLPGTITQDILTIAAAIALFLLALRARAESIKVHIVILGILGYLFYAYGIYVIERFYILFYYVYLSIFSLSFYSLVYGVASLRSDMLQAVRLPDGIRKAAVGFSLFVAVLFSLLWIMRLLPMLQAGEKPEAFYSVYIIDLAFIMPAFAILAVMAARKQGLGLVLTPAMYVLGATLLLPVGLGEFLKPAYGFPVDPGGAVLFLGITALFLVAAGLYLPRLKVDRPIS